MKLKRWLALLLAAALSAGLSLPAAAAGPELAPVGTVQGSTAAGEAFGQGPGAGAQEAGPTLGESGPVIIEEPLPEGPLPEEPRPSPLTWVRLPEQVSIVLDPYEIDGRGQIYSDPLIFANEGEEAVTITVSGLYCETGPGVRLQEGYAYGFASDFCYPDGERPRGVSILEALEADSGKRAQVFLRSLTTGEARILSAPRLTLGASGEEVLAGDSFSFVLEGGEAAGFEIAGNMTLPREGWESGDISVKMSFLAEWLKPEDSEVFEGPAAEKEPVESNDPADSEELDDPADSEESDDPADSEEPEGSADAGEPDDPVNSGEPEGPADAGEPEDPAVQGGKD